MRYQWAIATHPGRVRSNNEDAVHPTNAGRGEAPLVLMVADGMGGHVGGEVASQIAIDHALANDGSVEERVTAGNAAILAEVDRRPELAGMGTTITMVELRPDGFAMIGHVGDSRAYLLRKGLLRQLTEDHTIVNEYVKAGRIRAEDAADHPQRNMLTRALGLVADLTVDTAHIGLREGDRLLLCSDGVTSMISDDVIRDALTDSTPEEAVWELVELANAAGGHDNISAIVIDAEVDASPS